MAFLSRLEIVLLRPDAVEHVDRVAIQ